MSLVFKTNGATGKTAPDSGRPLSELAADAGFPLNLQCGGQGACNGCRVRLVSGSFRVGESAVEPPADVRACKTIVLSDDAEIEIPAASLLAIGECSSADFYATRTPLFHPPSLEGCGVAGPPEKDEGASACRVVGQASLYPESLCLSHEQENTRSRIREACPTMETSHFTNGMKLGIAVDIGTTTVAALLVDLSTGEILARESAYNRQIELGTDVSSRIALCCEADKVAKLQRLLIKETLFPMFGNLAKQGFQNIENVISITFSGNTVMSHLALGLSALSIGVIPFEPLMKVFREHPALEIGLDCCPNAAVRIVPAVAGYVGGDIVSDLYISKPSGDGLTLLVDIGTNGEIVLIDGEQMIATATAAGPAFEGAGLLHGARAGRGIIEEIACRPDDSIDVDVIGGGPARGLCGSAAIDFMATAFQTGLLNSMGRFDLDRLRAAGRLSVLDCHGTDVNACILTEDSALDEPVMISEFDVSQILKAKAAVYAGIRT
ncbi:MAG TPA: ASKHA domain-containing protein, partial [Tichowtungia sp.]|nr:ASKHA domain-containing protein [Tichowtungia sp.]